MSCFAGTITVEPDFDPNAVQIGSCSVSRTTITEGDSVEVSADVSNENDDPAEVYIRFHQNGSQIASDPVTVAGGEEHTFSYTSQPGSGENDYSTSIAGRGDTPNISDTCNAGTVSVDPPFDPGLVSIGSCGVSPGNITEGESVEAEVEITNENAHAADVEILYYRGNSRFNTQSRSLGAGETRSLSASDTPGEGAHDYSITIRGDAEETCSAGAVVVDPDFDPSSVYVDGCSIEPSNIDPGQTADVDVTIRNSNGYAAYVEADVQANGSVRDSFTGTIDRNSERTFTALLTPESSGEYEITTVIQYVEMA